MPNRIAELRADRPVTAIALQETQQNQSISSTLSRNNVRRNGLVQARVRHVEACVACAFGIRHEEIRGSTRGRAEVARGRQVAMYLCHTVLGFSLTTVGNLFERDRTTVGHACRLVEDLRDRPTFDDQIAYLERAVLAGCIAPAVNRTKRVGTRSHPVKRPTESANA